MKEGFHEDEYYSYFTSSGKADLSTNGSYQWRSGYDIQRQFLVEKGEEFHFSGVIDFQEQDVHPPLYYLLLNIVMSILSGSFYKWMGIFLNLIFSLISYCSILFFFGRLDGSKNKVPTLAAGLIHGLAPAVISDAMLARMYGMSSMWTVLFACVFVMLLQNHFGTVRKYAAITGAGAILCYLAFLTHYLSLVMPFFFTLGYCVYVLVKRKGILRMLLFGASCLTAIGLGVLTYPVSLDHIFDGYRGTNAISGLTNGDTLGMAEYFLPILDKNIFSGLLVPTMILLLLAIISLFIRWFSLSDKAELKSHTISWYGQVTAFISCILSLILLMKSVLTVGDESSRYFYPVVTLLLPLIAFILCHSFTVWRLPDGFFAIPCLFIVGFAVTGHLKGNVQFLYTDENAKISFSQEYNRYPALMIYNKDTAYRTWYTADQLWPFEKIFYIEQKHALLDIQDETLENAEKVILYVDYMGEDIIENIMRINTGLSNYTLVRHDPFFYVFLLE